MLFLKHLCFGRHVFENPGVGSDGCASADGDASQQCGVGVYDDVVFNDRVTRNALDGVALLVERETLGSERHALIELHVVSDDAGLADDHARSMVDGEMAAYCGAWVDVDSRFRMCHLCHHARNERHPHEKQLVGQPVAG